MPGKGCLARKAERKEQRRRLIAAEAAAEAEANGEPAAKVARIGDDEDPDLAKIAEEFGVGDSPTGTAAPPVKIWAEVPPLDALNEEDKEKAIALCRALYEACLGFGGEGCTVPQLGSHYKVQQLKKDPCFNRQRLVDILRRHEDVFEITAVESGGHRVHLQPGAMAACPGEAPIAPPMLSSESLPPLLEEPETMEEKFQALRIHVVHSLFKRGGKAVLHDLGQDPKIVELRKQILNGRSLLQFIKVFPFNFGIEDMGNGNFTIELTMLDVAETSMIKDAAEEFATEFVRGPKGGGKGKKGSNDGRCKFPVNPMMVMAMKGKMQEMNAQGKGNGKGKGKGSDSVNGKGKGKGKDDSGFGSAMAAFPPMMMMQMFMKGKAMGKGIFGGGWDSSWGGGGGWGGDWSSWGGGGGGGSSSWGGDDEWGGGGSGGSWSDAGVWASDDGGSSADSGW